MPLLRAIVLSIRSAPLGRGRGLPELPLAREAPLALAVPHPEDERVLGESEEEPPSWGPSRADFVISKEELIAALEWTRSAGVETSESGRAGARRGTAYSGVMASRTRLVHRPSRPHSAAR
jgi:hypothetical protein